MHRGSFEPPRLCKQPRQLDAAISLQSCKSYVSEWRVWRDLVEVAQINEKDSIKSSKRLVQHYRSKRCMASGSVKSCRKAGDGLSAAQPHRSRNVGDAWVRVKRPWPAVVRKLRRNGSHGSDATWKHCELGKSFDWHVRKVFSSERSFAF